MRFALEAANVGIWEMDCLTGDRRVVPDSRGAVRPGGRRIRRNLRRRSAQLIHPEDRAAVLETIDRSMKSGTDFSVLHRALWPDGTVRWLNGSGRDPARVHSANRCARVGISLDVTERHTLEEQYRQAQKMEAVGRLAGGRRPRLQQPPDRDSRLHRVRERRCCARRASTPGDLDRDHQGGAERRRPDPAAARVQPSAGAARRAARPERADRGHDRHARPADRRAHRGHADAGARSRRWRWPIAARSSRWS